MYTKQIQSDEGINRNSASDKFPKTGAKAAGAVSVAYNIKPTLSTDDIRQIIDTNRYKKEILFRRIGSMAEMVIPSACVLAGTTFLVNALFGVDVMLPAVFGIGANIIAGLFFLDTDKKITRMKEDTAEYEKMIKQLYKWNDVSRNDKNVSESKALEQVVQNINEMYPDLEQEYVDFLLTDVIQWNDEG